jgi:4-amino-4-deoxy-L-arabinose transferase-like glycosyltransferase
MLTTIDARLKRFEGECGRLLEYVGSRRALASLFLLLLGLFCYLPGVVQLPPVDRTEIIYAESSRGLLEKGEFLNPEFRGEHHRFRPIGTYWLQMAAASLGGEGARDVITSYRIPSLIGVLLAVLATYWLLAAPLGGRGALIAGGLVAVTPIFAVQSQLAVTEGAVVGAAVIAQLTLLRLYLASNADKTLRFALLFWAAQGFAVCLNALAVPILSVTTLVALYAFDRDLSWLKRTRPLVGLPIFLLLASPWLINRYIADEGVPFRGMAWGDFLEALGGSQDMKLRAFPGTFVLGLVLGFLPGSVLLWPAMKGLWADRAAALPRFLFAWIVGYLVYLELLSAKPALYTVQVLFPAAAAAVVLALTRAAAPGSPGQALAMPKGGLIAWPWLAALLIPALYAGVLWAAEQVPKAGLVVGAAAVALIFAAAARAGRSGQAASWVVLSVAGMALFISLTLGRLLPSLEKPWPARQIANAIAPLSGCASGPAGVVGFREPSATFYLRNRAEISTPAEVAEWQKRGERRLVVIEDRWHRDVAAELEARDADSPQRIGCVRAFNVMRGCPLSFSIYVTGPMGARAGCIEPPKFRCAGPVNVPPNDKATQRCR